MANNASDRNQEIEKLIIEEIQRDGRLTFARFMELVLYHPELGYYTSRQQRVGKEGDFYTSPHVHPMFGGLLARQIEEMWRAAGQDERFTIVEFGAGSGLLAADILQALSPGFLAAVHYAIIEINPHLMDAQRRRLAELRLPEGKLEWAQNMEDAFGAESPRVGCVLSNELIDAFPVHRVKRKGRKIREIYVGFRGNRFVEILDEPSTPEIDAYLTNNEVRLADGQEIEVNLRALRWLDEVAQFLDKGFVLTIDYGYESRDLAGPRFFNGSLMAYRQHKASHDLYAAVGAQDLTAHVNFTALMNHGTEVGLATTGYTTQMNFLMALALVDGSLAKSAGGDALSAYKDTIALKQLMMPGGMGEVFKVLIQHKGLERPELTGLKRPW